MPPAKIIKPSVAQKPFCIRPHPKTKKAAKRRPKHLQMLFWLRPKRLLLSQQCL